MDLVELGTFQIIYPEKNQKFREPTRSDKCYVTHMISFYTERLLHTVGHIQDTSVRSGNRNRVFLQQLTVQR